MSMKIPVGQVALLPVCDSRVMDWADMAVTVVRVSGYVNGRWSGQKGEEEEDIASVFVFEC